MEPLLALLLASGAYGALWVSDDFDEPRLALLVYGGLPLAFAYYALWALYPRWRQRWPRLRFGIAGALALIAALAGHVPMVNALTADEGVVKRTVPAHEMAVQVDARRGGLGMLFKTRW